MTLDVSTGLNLNESFSDKKKNKKKTLRLFNNAHIGCLLCIIFEGFIF